MGLTQSKLKLKIYASLYFLKGERERKRKRVISAKICVGPFYSYETLTFEYKHVAMHRVLVLKYYMFEPI